MSKTVLVLLFLSVLTKAQLFEKCRTEEHPEKMIKCAGLRLLKFMERLDKQDSIQIVPGVSLTRNASSLQARNFNPNNSIDALGSFLSNRVLKLELPMELPRAFAEEGRAKMKKMMSSLILGLGAKMMTMVPLMFGALALLTTKAIIVGKLALVISVILFVRAFLSGGGFSQFGGGSYGVPQYGPPVYGTNSLGGGGWSSGGYP